MEYGLRAHTSAESVFSCHCFFAPFSDGSILALFSDNSDTRWALQNPLRLGTASPQVQSKTLFYTACIGFSYLAWRIDLLPWNLSNHIMQIPRSAWGRRKEGMNAVTSRLGEKFGAAYLSFASCLRHDTEIRQPLSNSLTLKYPSTIECHSDF
jgi:hypothetical protein